LVKQALREISEKFQNPTDREHSLCSTKLYYHQQYF